MYPIFLFIHSLTRYAVVFLLIYMLFRCFRGFRLHKPFTLSDRIALILTTTFVYLQFTIGMILYFISPLIHYFFDHLPDSTHEREIRFFGMEHSLVMTLSVILVAVGHSKSSYQASDKLKFKILRTYFGIAFLLILSSVPWTFSPLTHRPWIRTF